MTETCAECKKKIIMTRPFYLEGKPYCSGVCHRKAIAKMEDDKNGGGN